MSNLLPDARMTRRTLGTALVLAAAGALTACIVVPAGRRYAPPPGAGPRGDAYDEDDVVTVAPPAPQVDVWVAAPGPGFFWTAGHWGWLGGRHVWVGGRWQAQRPGWRWVPFAWQRHPRGWRAAPGRWQRY